MVQNSFAFDINEPTYFKIRYLLTNIYKLGRLYYFKKINLGEKMPQIKTSFETS